MSDDVAAMSDDVAAMSDDVAAMSDDIAAMSDDAAAMSDDIGDHDTILSFAAASCWMSLAGLSSHLFRLLMYT